jgi:predicted nucleic acid-binding protein
MSYLVDSDWIIDALTGIPSAIAALEQHVHEEALAVSILSFGEIFDGAYDFPKPDQHIASYRRFLSGFIVLGLNDPIMELFAQHRYRLRRQGNIIPDMDILIAATALHHDLTLMTRNLRHFSRIPDLKLYQPS